MCGFLLYMERLIGDSKDIAFQIAGEVFKRHLKVLRNTSGAGGKSGVTVRRATGDIMGDLSSRRGKIGG